MTEYQVGASVDDGRELSSGIVEVTGGNVRITSSPTALVRFTNLTTYTLRKIQTAYLSFYTVGGFTSAHFNIRGQNTATPAPLTTTTNDITSRPVTTAVASMAQTATNNAWINTVSIKDVIQEVLDTHGAVTELALVLQPVAASDYAFRTYDHTPAESAKLILVFTTVTTWFTGSPLSGLYATQVDSVTFSNSSTTDDPNGFTGGSAGWLWQYKKDAGSWTTFSTAQNPTLGSLAAGTYSIRLTATSNDGTANTLTRTNYFTVAAARTATADFSGSPVSGDEPLTVDFTDTSTTDDPGGIISWNWERKLAAASSWSTFSVAENPSQAFAVGDWDVRLTVTTDLGATDTETKSSYVSVTVSGAISVFGPFGVQRAPLRIDPKPEARPLIPFPAPAGVVVTALIGDANGRVLAEIRPFIQSVAWRRSRPSKVQIDLARSDAGLVEAYLRFGNRLYLEFDNGLPPWGGVIDDPREWDFDRQIATASSAERLVYRRRTVRTVQFRGSTVGAIFGALIEQALAYYPAGFMRAGSVWGGGGEHSVTYHYHNLGRIFEESLVGRLSAYSWDVSPLLETRQTGTCIVFEANLYGPGRDLVNYALEEPANVTAWRGRERGDITNDWVMVGDNVDGWGDERLTAVATDAASIAQYGLAQGFEVRQGVVEQSTLDETVVNRLAKTAWPRAELALETANRNPAKFADYRLHDTIPLTLVSYGYGGWSGRVRVLAREFHPDSGVCDLVIEEVT